MNFSEIFRFSARLVAAKPARSVLVILSIFLSVAILTLFFGFSRGVENLFLKTFSADSENKTLLVFSKNPQKKGIFSFGKNHLDFSVVDDFQKMPGVAAVEPQTVLEFPSTIVIPLGLNFETDMFFFGISSAAFSGKKIQKNEIPIVLNPKILDLYNSSFPQMIPGISAVSPSNLVGKKIKIQFGKSSFLPDFGNFLNLKKVVEKTGVIVGFDRRAPIFGFSIPQKSAKKMTAAVLQNPQKKPKIMRILIVAKNEIAAENIKKNLADRDFFVQSFSAVGEKMRRTIIGFRATILALGGAILAISLFSLLAILLVSLFENRQNIGILKSFGTKNRDLFLIFLGEATILAGGGAILGILAATILAAVFNFSFQKIAENFSFAGERLFLISGFDAATILAATLFLALFFASFPIFFAVKKEILKLLWK